MSAVSGNPFMLSAHEVPSHAWLGTTVEAALWPDQVIVDAHHHLWDRVGHTYLLPEFLAEVRDSGHRVVSTVHVQARSMYRCEGNPAMAVVGETEFLRGVAASTASGYYGNIRVADAIVGHADLSRGRAVAEVLQAHVEAGGGRFKGIRHISTWDADPTVVNPALRAPRHLLADGRFLEGFEELARLGLSFDAWAYHTQLWEIADLARRFPETTIVLNHLGGPLNVGPYERCRDSIRQAWLESMGRLAACANVRVKLGGVGMKIFGFDHAQRATAPGSAALAEDIRPYILPVIDLFGADRCMFESNFPVDKRSFSYGVVWNAFKRVSADMSQDDRDWLFYRTAATTYRLSLSHLQ